MTSIHVEKIPCTPSVFFTVTQLAGVVGQPVAILEECRGIHFNGVFVIIDDSGIPHVLIYDEIVPPGLVMDVISRCKGMDINWEIYEEGRE